MKLLSYLCIAMCVAALPLGAALSTSTNYKSALSQSNARKPVVLFCYGANYDKVSEKVHEEFISKRKLHRAVGPASGILVAVPIFQLPDEKEKKVYDKVMGGAGLPGGIWSYPSLAVVDSSGRVRGVVQSAAEMQSPETAGAALVELLNDFKEQESLLEKAAKTSGKRKIRLLTEAAEYKTRMPSETASLDNKQLVEDLQIKSPEGANAHIRNLMANNCYSRRQRQEILAAYAGHLRRNGASADRLRAVYTEMRNIDPTSIYAIYAEGAIELWVVPKENAPKGAPKGTP